VSPCGVVTKAERMLASVSAPLVTAGSSPASLDTVWTNASVCISSLIRRVIAVAGVS
jgi:hypothetical protein